MEGDWLKSITDEILCAMKSVSDYAWDNSIRLGILASDHCDDLPPEDVLRQFGRIEILQSGARRFIWRGKVVAVQLPVKITSSSHDLG